MAGDPAQLPLRDIHLPEPVSWWPPAPGWWVLLLTILLLVIFLLLRAKRQQRNRLRTVALAELGELRGAWRRHNDPALLIRQLSTLMRRVSMSCFPREQVAGLTGESWLQFLDEQSDGCAFREGAGRCLSSAPYQAQTDVDGDVILSLCDSWIRSVVSRRSA